MDHLDSMATPNGHAAPSNGLGHQSRPSQPSPGLPGSVLTDPITRPSNIPRNSSRPLSDSQISVESEKQAAGDPHSRVRGQSSRDSIASRRSARRVSSIDNEKVSAKDDSRIQLEAQIATVRTLKADLETLRSILACKICTRLLYEPYTVSCGHTFCYSCLRQWFSEHQSRKTCPECRADVKQIPAPAYLVRELMDTFIGRSELLPAEESIEEHRRLRKEENECVERDRLNKDPRSGGLFKGCFKPEITTTVRAVRDHEDGVDRCPMCHWEIEDNRCGQCGLRFDLEGNVTLGRGSFSGVSEYSSAQSYRSDDDYDREMDMDEFGSEYGLDFSVGSGYMDEEAYLASLEDGSTYSIPLQRELAHGNIQRPSRPASRSSYGSRMRRYTPSVVSDMYPSEDGSMATVEEEDEDEDSATDLSGFIVGEGSDARGSSNARRTSSLGESRVSSDLSSVRSIAQSSLAAQSNLSHDDDDDDEGGPISNGRRRQRRISSPTLRRPHRFGPIALSVSSGAENDGLDMDEDTQALLQQPGWNRLDQDDNDGSMDYDSDEDDVRTTIGADSPTSFAADRDQFGGSVTPTASQPHPGIRPPSRSMSRPNGSRGLRRKGSSVSVTNYDNEADDDDSDSDMVEPSTGTTSRPNIRNAPSTGSIPVVDNLQSQGLSIGDAIDVESDSASDQSIQAPRRRRAQQARTREYNPRISMLFAQHQSDLESVNSSSARGSDFESRSRTPSIRPRITSRNSNQSSLSSASSHVTREGTASSSISAHSRISGIDASIRGSASGSENSDQMIERAHSRLGFGASASPSVRSTASASQSGYGQNHHGMRPTTPLSNTENGFQAPNVDGSLSPRSASSIFERPPSRTSRSTNGQARVYGSPSFNHTRANGGFGQATTGLSINRSLQPHPWAHLIPRQSHARLRDAPSNATLRARQSRSQMRAQASPSAHPDLQGMENAPLRSQTSRSSLSHVPSHQRLRNRQSSRALQAAQAAAATAGTHQVQQPALPSTRSGSVSSDGVGHRRLTEEERLRRGNEIVRQRQAELQLQRLAQRGSVEPNRQSVGPSNGSQGFSLSASPQQPQHSVRRVAGSTDQGPSFSERSASTYASNIAEARQWHQSIEENANQNRSMQTPSNLQPSPRFVSSSASSSSSIRSGVSNPRESPIGDPVRGVYAQQVR